MHIKTLTRSLLFFVSAALAMTACKGQAPSSEAAKPKTLNVYTWSNYFNPEAIEKFQASSGVQVNFSYFSSNEELLAKLQAGARGYDVIVPSGYVVRAMKSLDLLMPLNAEQFPQVKHLRAQFRSPPFDPKLEYVVPFSWGTTGLAVNTKKVKGTVDSWAWVFTHPELKGQITMLDDPPDVVGSALKFLGYSINEQKPEALAKAKALLKKQKTILKAFTSETIPLLEAGDVAIAHAYSSDVGQVMVKNPSIKFITPKEGGVVWVDNLAIPKGALSVDSAKAFIQFMLQPEIAALQSAHLYTNPVVELPESGEVMKKLRAANLYPSDAVMKKLEFTSDDPVFHDAVLKLWTELKAE